MLRCILLRFDPAQVRWSWMDRDAPSSTIAPLGPSAGDPIRGDPKKRWTKAMLRRAGQRKLETWLSHQGVVGSITIVDAFPTGPHRSSPMIVRLIPRRPRPSSYWLGADGCEVDHPDLAKMFLGSGDAFAVATKVTLGGQFVAIPEPAKSRPVYAKAS